MISRLGYLNDWLRETLRVKWSQTLSLYSSFSLIFPRGKKLSGFTLAKLVLINCMRCKQLTADVYFTPPIIVTLYNVQSNFALSCCIVCKIQNIKVGLFVKMQFACKLFVSPELLIFFTRLRLESTGLLCYAAVVCVGSALNTPPHIWGALCDGCKGY